MIFHISLICAQDVHVSVSGFHGAVCKKDGDQLNLSFKVPCHWQGDSLAVSAGGSAKDKFNRSSIFPH